MLNAKLKEPLKESEIRSIVRCCARHRYKMSAKKIKDLLDLRTEFMRTSKICYTVQRVAARKENANRYFNGVRKAVTAEKKNKKINIIRSFLRKKEYRIVDIMKATGWCRNTVKKYIAIILKEREALREKHYERANKRDEVRTDAQEITQDIMREKCTVYGTSFYAPIALAVDSAVMSN